ncbi:MAG: class I SAM-dependent methyltransferase [Clostridia bacterium]|nr:class I SAM-dependent methyltransferase [Clostridia bacterium]
MKKTNLCHPDLSNGLLKRENFNNYNKWIYDNIKPFLGKRILDIGSGTGTFIKYFIDNSNLVIGTDIFEKQIKIMKALFSNKPNVIIEYYSIEETQTINNYQDKDIDTITCINVLEHIKNDRLALENMKSIVKGRGRIIILVPAFDWLFGTMDEAAGHYRRYNKNQLKELAKDLDLSVVNNTYMNILGIIPWYIKGKVIKIDSTFSENFTDNSLTLYNYAALFLRKIENFFPVPIGISEIIVLQKNEI